MKPSLSYKDILELYFDQYIHEFGQQKFMIACDKVMASEKVSGLISRSKQQRAKPSFEHLINLLPQISFFFFSKDRTLALGCIIALERWNTEVNVNGDYMDEEELSDIASKIISKYRIQLFGSAFEMAAWLSERQTIEVIGEPIEDVEDHEEQLTYDQRCAIVSTLFFIANGDGEISTKERQLINPVSRFLDIRKKDSEYMNQMNRQSRDYVCNILKSLSADYIAWFLLIARAITRADGTIRQAEYKKLHFTFTKMGLTFDEFQTIIQDGEDFGERIINNMKNSLDTYRDS
jgi:uncharacterized tellurite resistance protein B-like protein